MAALAASGAAEGLWLRADRQHAGRGRQARQWISPAGNLHASSFVGLRDCDPPAPTLALLAAVALHEAGSIHAPDRTLHLNWPTDLMAGQAKVAGALLERAGDHVVIGIGVNLGHAPVVEGRETTTLSAHPVEPAVLLRTLAESFARWLATWRGQGFAPVRRAWLAAAHPPGTALRVRLPDEPPIDGLFAGLDGDGALRLKTAEGERLIRAGDVFLI